MFMNKYRQTFCFSTLVFGLITLNKNNNILFKKKTIIIVPKHVNSLIFCSKKIYTRAAIPCISYQPYRHKKAGLDITSEIIGLFTNVSIT